MAPSALTISAANNNRKRIYSRRLLKAPPEKEERPLYRFLRYRAIRLRGCRQREKQCSDRRTRSISGISEEKTGSSHFLSHRLQQCLQNQKLAPIHVWETSFTIEARQMLHGPEFAESRAILGCLAIPRSSGSQLATTHRTDHRRYAQILVTVGSDAHANQHIFR
jgi:hypothetical protein